MNTDRVILHRPHTDPRRHDLDALRAFAMLLGIVLHSAMSFIPGVGVFWGIQDAQSNPIYGVLLASIHGWRMPLFFLISGFFTAMLWRKRGLRALLIHRFKRIFLPMLLALVTVIPLILVVSRYVRSFPADPTSQAVHKGSTSSTPDEPGAPSEQPHIDAIAAVATNDLGALKAYLQQGGDVHAKDSYGSTPLHVACLFGRAEAAEMLLEADASLEIQNNEGGRPEDLLKLDWGTTAFIAKLVQVPVSQSDVQGGRERIAKSFSEKAGRSVSAGTGGGTGSPAIAGLIAMLFFLPVFHHLWFLWFLCWYVCGFTLLAKLCQGLRIPAVRGFWMTSLVRYAWLIPLTAAPQFFMASQRYVFGPDTSTGLLPLPTVFAYYAIFFGYGAIYFSAGDDDAAVGRWYGWKLFAALFILFPAGLSLQGSDSTGGRILFAVLQVSYAWVMSFGMIGLFHRFFDGHRSWVRYLSDSSYWLYLVHLPLVMLLQFLVRDMPLASYVKFAIVCMLTTMLLLMSYQMCVRNSWIGALLNGQRHSTPSILARMRAARAPVIEKAAQDGNT